MDWNLREIKGKKLKCPQRMNVIKRWERFPEHYMY